MTDNYAQIVAGGSRTSPTKPIRGREQDMVANRGGGYAFAVTHWDQLKRFLIMGAETNYYANKREMTLDNVQSLQRALEEDGVRVVNMIEDLNRFDVSTASVISKEPSLFALAYAKLNGDLNTRQAVHRVIRDGHVVRTGRQMFDFLHNLWVLNGETIPAGSGFKRAINDWITERSDRSLAYQMLKYRGSTNNGHEINWQDLLRIMHPHASNYMKDQLLAWMMGNENVFESDLKHGASNDIIRYVRAYLELGKATEVKQVVQLIHEFGFTHEMVPNEFVNELDVNLALIGLPTQYGEPARRDDGSLRYQMPLFALLRNLSNFARRGLIPGVGDLHGVVGHLENTFGDEEYVRRSGIHPLKVYQAMCEYRSGESNYGRGSWKPNARLLDALEDMFYASFANVEASGANILIAIDRSGSMSSKLFSNSAGGGIPAVELAVVTAMALVRAEKNVVVVAYDYNLYETNITARDSLSGALRKVDTRGGSTNTALPIQWAANNRDALGKFDAIITFTDNEVNSGSMHPVEALRDYRQAVDDDSVRYISAATSATAYSVTDPNDKYQLSITGFDSRSASLVSDFIAGRLDAE